MQNHYFDGNDKYPVIPPSADDEESSRRNNELLRTESDVVNYSYISSKKTDDIEFS